MSGTVEIKLWFQPSIADQISGVCEQIRNCCFCCTANTLTFPDSSCFQRNFFQFFFTSLTAYAWAGPGQAALYGLSVACRQVVFIWLTHENLWFSVRAAKSHPRPPRPPVPLLFWIWLETLGAHFKESRRLLSGDRACDTRKWMYTIGIRWICLSTQRKCRQFMPAFCSSCLFFHFVISSLP